MTRTFGLHKEFSCIGSSAVDDNLSETLFQVFVFGAQAFQFSQRGVAFTLGPVGAIMLYAAERLLSEEFALRILRAPLGGVEVVEDG